MSQQTLTELLGGILDTYGDRIEAIKEGRAPESDWDGPPLPLNYEYRVEVDSSVVSPSKASGKDQFVITYVIKEPSEFAGRKVQGYYAKDSPNEWARKALADLFGALKADMSGWGEDDIDGFAGQFVGRSAVIAVDSYGDDEDRFSVRWVNFDRGQTLKTDVKPKAKKGGGGDANLKADIVIPKDTAQGAAPAPASPPLPGGDSKPVGGPNLPPGLR